MASYQLRQRFQLGAAIMSFTSHINRGEMAGKCLTAVEKGQKILGVSFTRAVA
jgi:hypothetical protein